MRRSVTGRKAQAASFGASDAVDYSHYSVGRARERARVPKTRRPKPGVFCSARSAAGRKPRGHGNLRRFLVAHTLARVSGAGTRAFAPLSAVWTVPWFVTQDGPAHIYNAQILAESFKAESPSRAIYTIEWKPIPNWSGELILAALVSCLPAWIADRIMTSATLLGLAAATLWLRWRVAGGKGLVLAARSFPRFWP